MNVKIKDIPLIDRPRERLKTFGASSLSNEELLAIILKTGTKDASAKMLASKLLSEVGDIKNLVKLNFTEITKFKGIGEAKACELLSIIELSKRINNEITTIQNVKITSTIKVYKYYKDKLKNKLQEHFYCLYLDSSKRVIEDKLLFKGTLNQSIVHPREIFKEAYLLSASSIICVHNHPSGNIMPSNEDVLLTDKLVDIGNLLGIKVIDHVIVGNDNYYSFYENNLIGGKKL
ncbi:MAG: DNA repair protein RadC [Bacilli bacterium]|nr:DNA repair protein RadC [Bacilli bacterium]MDD4282395.1 DNA repair protein RadC [Bacilli bacterium]MDD4718980.1 DNA repair protein RadC [Bacilli bacterium]